MQNAGKKVARREELNGVDGSAWKGLGVRPRTHATGRMRTKRRKEARRSSVTCVGSRELQGRCGGEVCGLERRGRLCRRGWSEYLLGGCFPWAMAVQEVVFHLGYPRKKEKRTKGTGLPKKQKKEVKVASSVLYMFITSSFFSHDTKCADPVCCGLLVSLPGDAAGN